MYLWFLYANLKKKEMVVLDYVIKNHNNVYIRLNENGSAVSCGEKDRGFFEHSKAKNI